MDDDLLLVGETQSVLTDECDGEGYAIHGLFPAWPVDEFILCLQNNESNKVLSGLTKDFRPGSDIAQLWDRQSKEMWPQKSTDQALVVG